MFAPGLFRQQLTNTHVAGNSMFSTTPCSSPAPSRIRLLPKHQQSSSLLPSRDAADSVRAWPPSVRCAVSFSTSSSSKQKTLFKCSNCGWEAPQHWGKCRQCQQYDTMQEELRLPAEPAAAPAASGASAATAALRRVSNSSSRTSSSSRGGGSSSSGSSRQAAAAVRASSLLQRDFTDEGGYDEDDSNDLVSDGYDGSSSSSGGRLAWVSEAVGPERLSAMVVDEQQLRLPLAGPTGAEVSRVLGGGVVPGSLVLVGGEPGMGKSTLLLQLAGLIAASCSSSSNSSGSRNRCSATDSEASHSLADDGDDDGDDGDDDVPLTARRAGRTAAAAAAATPSSSRSNTNTSSSGAGADTGWLVGAAGSAPREFRGRPVLYVTAEESREQVWERARRLGLVKAVSNSVSDSINPAELDVQVMVESRLDKIADAMVGLRPAAVVIDSIQTVALADIKGRPGGPTQVTECAVCLMQLARQLSCATFLVGHITKVGGLAGPKQLEHLVDVVLIMQGAGVGTSGRLGGVRLLRALKNRHGRVGEVGMFEMRPLGLTAVEDAARAALLLPSTDAARRAGDNQDSDGARGPPVGTGVGVVMAGARPVPIEIQALAIPRLVELAAAAAAARAPPAPSAAAAGASDWEEEGEEEQQEDEGAAAAALGADSSGGGSSSSDDDGVAASDDGGFSSVPDDAGVSSSSSRQYELSPLFRQFVGVTDKPRMAMLLELLSAHAGIKAHMFNLYLNVVSGYRLPLGETSTDLALAAAITSSITNTPLPPGTALLGELGLAGELRPVPAADLCLLELSKLGFTQVIVPAASGSSISLTPAELGRLRVVRMRTLKAALLYLFGEAALAAAGRKQQQGSRAGSSSSSSDGGRRQWQRISSRSGSK